MLLRSRLLSTSIVSMFSGLLGEKVHCNRFECGEQLIDKSHVYSRKSAFCRFSGLLLEILTRFYLDSFCAERSSVFFLGSGDDDVQDIVRCSTWTLLFLSDYFFFANSVLSFPVCLGYCVSSLSISPLPSVCISRLVLVLSKYLQVSLRTHGSMTGGQRTWAQNRLLKGWRKGITTSCR